jgi:hypothetical protein
VLANVAASLFSPTSLIGYAITLLIVAAWLVGWHRRRIREGKHGVEPWHLIIAGMAGVVIFAAVALGGVIWQARHNAPSVAANPPPASTSPTSGAKKYTSYDIEQRLRAIDEIYAFLGSNLMAVSAAGERLAEGGLIFEKIKNGVAITELDQHAEMAKNTVDEYYKLTAKYMYFPDIYTVASSTTDGTPLDVISSSLSLRAELQEMTQRGQIEQAYDYLRNNKLLEDWRASMAHFWPWINKKQQELTQKRRQYEQAEVYPR